MIDAEDDLVDTTAESLAPAEALRRRPATASTATSPSTAPARFGYTVRVVPKNALLASAAELGVVALP